MSYLGENQPVISGVLSNGSELAPGQVIRISSTVAISGVLSQGGIPAFTIMNPTTGTVGPAIRPDGISVRPSTLNGLFDEFAGSQVGFYYNNNRIFYIDSFGINLQEKYLQGVRRSVVNSPVSTTIASQSAGALYQNRTSVAPVTMTLNLNPGFGHAVGFYKTANQTFRVAPNTGASISTPTGVLPVGKYIELVDVGTCVELIADAAGNWLITSQVGTVVAEL